MFRIRFFILPFIALLTFTGLAQNDAQQQLSKIRSEIANLQSQLRRSESTLKSSLAELENFDRQTNLQQQALKVLQKGIQDSRSAISRLNKRIDVTSDQITELKALFKKQIQFSYKYTRGNELEWLLGAENFNQALVRYRYFQAISESGRRLHDRLQKKRGNLVLLQNQRSEELAQQRLLASEKEKEQNALQSKIADRRQLISSINRDKSLLEKALAEKNESFRKLQGMIGNLERDRGQRDMTPQQQIEWDKIKGQFARQKQKLNWPVSGQIINKFGRYKNPKLKTIQVNNGIDIKAAKGEAVRCVFSGAVSVITYLSGYGNTVIIDHDNGYYTVYAHLDEIFIKKFEVIDAGTVIGTIGESGSLDGAMLHFEIYGNNQAQNPQSWLKK